MTSGRRKNKGISFYKFQANNQRRKQVVTSDDLRASSSKTTLKLLKSLGLDNLEKSHRPKLRSDAMPVVLHFALTKIKVWRNSEVEEGYFHQS